MQAPLEFGSLSYLFIYREEKKKKRGTRDKSPQHLRIQQDKYILNLCKCFSFLYFIFFSHCTQIVYIVHSKFKSTLIFPSSTCIICCLWHFLTLIPKTASPAHFFSAPLTLIISPETEFRLHTAFYSATCMILNKTQRSCILL